MTGVNQLWALPGATRSGWFKAWLQHLRESALVKALHWHGECLCRNKDLVGKNSPFFTKEL